MNDLISRQAAIEAVCRACSDDFGECPAYTGKSSWCEEIVALRAVPSAQPEMDCQKCIFCGFAGFKQFQTAQPERKEARWIFETLDGMTGYRPTVMFCSKCGRVSIADYNYCPNCGARMGGENDE